jgi:hypothetical protein
MSKIHPCVLEEVKHSTQKERRIIDTLEPVMNRHRLVFDQSVVDKDYKSAQAYEAENKYTKSLIYQMTRISYEKGALKHDDRLDALAIAVAYWTERMGQDADRGISKVKQEALDKELKKFIEHASQRSSGGSDRWFSLRGR